MFQFKVTPSVSWLGELLVVIDTEEQTEPVEPRYQGDPNTERMFKIYLSEFGMAPDRLTIDADKYSAQDLHFTLSQSKKMTFKVVAGEIEAYKTSIVADDESEPGFAMDSADLNYDQLQAADSMDALEEAFFALLEAISEDKEGDADEAVNTFGVRIGTIKAREALNAKAREIVARIKALNWEADTLTAEDRDVLMQYSGRGGLTDNSQSEYYTPTPVAEATWEILKGLGFSNGAVLEPSSGSGVFSATKPAGVHVTGTEIDETAAGVNRILHPDDTILNQPFERLAVSAEDNSYDAVIGNLPFGDVRGSSVHDDPEYKSERYMERYFLLRALHKVKPGGLVAVIVPGRVISNTTAPWKKFRAEISRLGEFLGGHKLPSKTFNAQGTDVTTDIIVMRKHPADVLERMPELSTDILTEANALWEPFIAGRWFKTGEGAKFIHGEYIPPNMDDVRPQEKVVGKMVKQGRKMVIDFAHLKEQLARRFESRIDWDLLSSAEPVQRTFSDGDVRSINGVDYQMQDGTWQPVARSVGSEGKLDPALFGADSLDALKAKLSHHYGMLDMSYSQAKAVYDAFPQYLDEGQKAAVRFASRQPEYDRDSCLNGSLLGLELMRVKYQIEEGQLNGDRLQKIQDMITASYDKYGDPKLNKETDYTGADSQYYGMFRAAIDKSGEFSDLMKGVTTSAKSAAFDDTDAEAIVSHLYHRIGYRDISLDDLNELWGGAEPLTLHDIAGMDDLAITADGLILPMSIYCSGLIYETLDATTAAIGKETDVVLLHKLEKQRKKLLQDRPFLPTDQINFGMRQKWVDRQYVLDFLKEAGYIGFKCGYWTDETYSDPVSGEERKRRVFVDDPSSPFAEFTGHENGGNGFYKELNRYLNGEPMRSKNNKEEYMRLAQQLEERFSIWMRSHEDADVITEQYNRKFNGFKAREYDSSDLELTGVAKAVRPHGFQNAGIRRLSEDGAGILAFDVGLGKTFSALGLAAYNNQKGRAGKTVITCPKNVNANWYHEAKKFFGTMDRVLFIGFEPVLDKAGNVVQEPVLDEEGNQKINKYTGEPEIQDKLREHSAEEIYDLMWQIPQTAKPFIIMPETRFGMIPLKSSTKENYMNTWVEKSLVSDRMAAETVAGGKIEGMESGTSYKDAKRLEGYRQKFSDDGTKKKDEYPYFEDMGINSVIADEGHAFKNTFEAGKDAQRLAYLSTPTPSQRAMDMNMKMSYLRDSNGGRGSYMLTATPLTNSPLEMFNMLSQVLPVSVFEQFGVYTPDDFIRVFAKTEVIDRVSVSGSLVSSEALVGFQNLTGLRSLYHRYVLQKNAKDPEVADFLSLPEADEQQEEVALNEAQREVYEGLREEAEAARTKEVNSRPIFSIIRDMDRATTDMDLFNRTMTFHFPVEQESSVRLLVDDLPETAKTSEYDPDLGKEVKTTVELTSNLAMSKSDNAFVLVVPEAFEDLVIARLTNFGIDEKTVSHPMTPKYARLMKNLLAGHEAGGKQIIFTEEKSQHSKIARLIAHHLPIGAGEIGIINAEDAAGAKLQRISDAYNSGKLRIIIANKKAEVGVNLQRGTTAIHHLTLPWTPASIQQRNGRGVRQGNTVSSVKVYYYLGKGSFDIYRLDLLQKKSGWIGDIMFGTENEADNADASKDEDLALMLAANPEEMKARLAEQRALKEADRQINDRVSIAVQVSQLMNAQRFIDDFETLKLAEKAAIEEKITKEEESLIRAEKRSAGDPENTELSVKVSDIKRRIAWQRRRLEAVDAEFAERKEKMAGRVKATKGYLIQRAEKGELSFKLDDVIAGQAVSLQNGLVISEGAFVEVAKSDRDDRYVFRVDKYKQGDGFLEITVIEDDKPYNNKVGRTIPLKITDLANYSASIVRNVKRSAAQVELSLLLNESHDYLSLSRIDSRIINDHAGAIKLEGYSQFLVRNPAGELGLASGNMIVTQDDGLSIQSIIFKSDSESLIKEVAQFLIKSTKGYARDYGVGEAWFGSSWRSEIVKYGTKATDAQILAFLTPIYDELYAEAVESEYCNLAMRDLIADNRARLEKVMDIGDNTDDISKVARNLMDTYMMKARSLHESRQIKKQEEEANALKEDPRYKELSPLAEAAFARIGITAVYNQKAIDKKAQRRGRSWSSALYAEPFGALWLQDPAGKNGRLYASKETLKSRFGAKFCTDPHPEMSGAWWYMPSSVSPEDVFESID